MRCKVNAVYDSKVEAFDLPFFTRARGETARAWTTWANDPQKEYSKYPGDYTLFEIGEFDLSTGELILYDAKVNLGTALQFKNVEEVQPVVRKVSG